MESNLEKKVKDSFFERFTRNLNSEVKKNKIDPVIGRDKEIRLLMQVLLRRKKSNPLLIGEPGIGKTAIVEGLAQRIVKGDVPDSLKNVEIEELDLGALIAGAKFQGEFEERLKLFINRIKNSDRKIIIFIDELHLIIGTGRTQGAMDAANLLKPMLARGELSCIGSTTFDEYREYIEKDAAFERRFSILVIKEPSLSDTLAILRGLKEKFETFHGVKIHDQALEEAVKLSDRYINHRFLPDKAIDLIDEACASTKIELDSTPEELDDIKRNLIKLEIEKKAIEQENDKSSKLRLARIIKEIDKERKKEFEKEEQWKKEKAKLIEIKNLRNQIESKENEYETCLREGEINRAAIVSFEVISLRKKLNELELKKNQGNDKGLLLKEDINKTDIEMVISKWTNIPLYNIRADEKEKLKNLAFFLENKGIKGQFEALSLISDSILRSRSGIRDLNKPIGSFIFLGQSGVGKTETAKILAEVLFNSKKNLIRLDMSEFMEKHSVSKIIGSPPGYIGFDKGGHLTEKIRHSQYAVVLFDEIEKAHPEVINILLQILDDGLLTDSRGRQISFKNVIVIMTSNIGSTYLSDYNLINKDKAIKELNSFFSSELMNRIDEIIVFKPLSESVFKQIIDRELKILFDRIFFQKKITFNVNEETKNKIFNSFSDFKLGARPIKRYIIKNIETLIAKAIINDQIKHNQNYLISINNNDEFFITTETLAD
jgi:ATP-dependent Clp protease ATP-binding subunit ClpB